MTHPDAHHAEHSYSNTILGFWIYLMTDCIMFAVLFAAYAALVHNTWGGLGAKELFPLPFALVQTLLLLTCTYSTTLAMLGAQIKRLQAVYFWYAVTFVLGAFFLGMEIMQFIDLTRCGHGHDKSAFLSAYYTLVGTHGVHVFFGLLWILVLLVPVVREGLTPLHMKRLTCLRMFWQFLNIIWVLIFTTVYLVGAL